MKMNLLICNKLVLLNTMHKYRGKMIHGNKKYNFEPLRKKGGTVTETTSNIYALKSSLRTFLKEPLKGKFDFAEIDANVFQITRTA